MAAIHSKDNKAGDGDCLLDSIHLHHKGYDQEGYIKTKNKEYERRAEIH